MGTVIKVARQLHKSKNLYYGTDIVATTYAYNIDKYNSDIFRNIMNNNIGNTILFSWEYYGGTTGVFNEIRFRNSISGQTLVIPNGVSLIAKDVSNFDGLLFYSGTENVPLRMAKNIQAEISTTPTPFKPYKNNYLPRHLLNRRSVIFE